ncbi:scarecrow-like protein 34 [Alnus glutinosa]|uniref:scarecrow-like protein 34 n=1 Tax=Alnus glutinosa TaxID=3517 RepID=UPI002D79CB61|nr:scarecrow-like protein 34 [Alnus glutinosa]XP_062171396.1 scarecrow-like protein 34 [Alnus glutinosa]XP_062171397.1 scarecrow-like protein 34 [Alnus glutinosa]XP_062171398.1 scarecrow-like protein 34 [Alnus glutinosa]
MDPTFSGLPDFINDVLIEDDHAFSPNSNQYPDLLNENEFNLPSPDLRFLESSLLSPDLGHIDFAPPIPVAPAAEPYALSAGDTMSTPSVGTSPGEDSSSGDSEFSDTVLKFISQILTEENIEDKPCLFYDPLGLQVTEKSFYDALSQNNPPSPKLYREEPTYINLNLGSPDDVFSASSGGDYGVSTSSSTSNSTDPQWVSGVGEYKSSISQAVDPGDYVFQPTNGSQFLANQSNSVTNMGDGMEFLAQNIFTHGESALQFRRGLEEANKFLPRGNQLVIDLGTSMVSPELKGEDQKVEKGEREISPDGLRGRKNHEREDVDVEVEEGRSNKQSAVYVEESELTDMFDEVLLSTEALSLLCGNNNNEAEQNEASKASQPNGQPQGANGGKSRSKKQGKKKETVDLRMLLILCAQAVSTGDNRTANELLKQIRQHSSPYGDGSQRLAHFFANGLEARLAGTGTGTQMFYGSLISKGISTSEKLKSYAVHLSSSPFKRMSLFFANKMILKVAEKATSLHIIDFGIGYGFHWPLLIHKLSKRIGGPPKLRITGIEFPQPGFRPTESIEETGQRLAKYCERFNVPFEYHVLASQNWETIQIEELKIDRNEMLAVNCMYRFKNLLDETVEETSPRNAVLNLIKRINPDVFVHAIVNGSYNAPFFVTRFREALYHFSSLFDIFDVTLPRENQQRLLFEREFLGRECMNILACEGLQRVERPETCKQWQVRTIRSGFRQLPLDGELMSIFRSKMKEWYHKDFVLDEDNHWMLQGWKGRILYASSCWVPN